MAACPGRSEGPRLKPTTSQLPPFPNGWYRLCDSHMVPKGGILPVTILAQEVVAFRGKSGQVRCIVMCVMCVWGVPCECRVSAVCGANRVGAVYGANRVWCRVWCAFSVFCVVQ